MHLRSIFIAVGYIENLFWSIWTPGDIFPLTQWTILFFFFSFVDYVSRVPILCSYWSRINIRVITSGRFVTWFDINDVISCKLRLPRYSDTKIWTGRDTRFFGMKVELFSKVFSWLVGACDPLTVVNTRAVTKDVHIKLYSFMINVHSVH